MSKYHCWYTTKRMLCAAMAIVLFAGVFVQTSISAAETTDQAAKPGTNTVVPEHLGIPETAAPDSAVATKGYADSPAAPVVDDDFAFPETDEFYDLILTLRRKRDVLSPAIVGLQKGFTNYLPLLELARVLKFPTQADLATGIARGTFMNPENTFTLDASAGTITVNGQTAPIPEGSVAIQDLGQGLGDIYVTPEVLNALWPIELEISFSDLTAYIRTKQLLPYEKEEKRRQQQDSLTEEEIEARRDLGYIPNNYKTYGLPALNFTEQLFWDGSEKALTNSLTASGEGDLLGASADYTLNTTSKSGEPLDVTSARLRFTRRDFGVGNLPYGLKIAQAGDVSTRASPLIDKVLSGRGLYVSSSERARERSFDEVAVQGTGPPGWEVEIYRDRELLDFGFIDERGEYLFEGIPLSYGTNPIRVVLYGPQGQIEERIQEYEIGRNLLEAGKTTFDAGIVDFRQDLIDLNDDDDDRKDEGWAKTLRVNRGISYWLTGFATLAITPTTEGTKEYASVGGLFNAFGGTGQIEAYKQLDGGAALDARFARQFAGIRFNLRSSVFRDFESREAGFGDTAKTFEGEFRASKNFNLGTLGQLGLILDTEHTRLENGRDTTRIRTHETFTTDRYSLNNSIITTRQDGEHKTSDGTLAFSTGFKGTLSLRTSLDYDIYPEHDLERLQIEGRYNDHDRFTAGVRVTQGLRDTNSTAVALSSSYDFGTFLGGSELEWDSEDGVSLLLSANTTFGPEGADNDYVFTTDYRGNTTAILARAFLDKDMNGEFGQGDEPLEKVRLRVNGNRSPPSNADGYIDFNNAGPEGLVEITVDRDSLPDPFLTGLREGYKTVLRRRTKPFIDFAMILTGTIDGTVRLPNGEPASGLIIQLVDQAGNVLMESPTVFDGFYTFEFVKPGTYTVRVAPSHPVFVPTETVTVTSADLFAYGVDLQVMEQAVEVSVAAEADGESGRIAQVYHAPVTDGTEQPAPFSSDGRFQAAVRAVRIGEHPHRVRLVLDLSGPASYEISQEAGGKVTWIDLPGFAWDADRTYTPGDDTLFTSMQVLALPGGGTRLRLESASPHSVFYNAALPPENGNGHRMYVDFSRAAN